MKKIFICILTIFVCITVFAQQLPVGQCGIVYLYDANGARVKRVYFCNNGTSPYPEARTEANAIAIKAAQQNDLNNNTNANYTFEKIDAIFPNPTSGIVNIEFTQPLLNTKVSIIDVNGKLLQNVLEKTKNFQLDLSAYKTGVYFLRIDNKGKLKTYKIIKN